ncbi:hypothetical protein C450_18639 [Halococcus salifodinae DSM 8989]|uniref:Uncharacterized protein n=1 Tax=Halococcus salifodinae DSM 8989 TaxID=1227456 RepID=M0MXA7_9EURY|nr:hypothetical protein C450_18639 [Halococcus salifodinae DSM 8989]
MWKVRLSFYSDDRGFRAPFGTRSKPDLVGADVSAAPTHDRRCARKFDEGNAERPRLWPPRSPANELVSTRANRLFGTILR